MPNEPLLLQLTQLTDSYSLRQKRANAVQAAFKLTGDALAKTQRALRDYAEHDTTVDVQAAQEAFGRVRVKEEGIDPLAADLRREIKGLAALIAALKESATALRAEPVDVVRLDKALAAIQASKEPGVAEVIPELQGELDLAQRALGDEFGQKLRAALQALGVAIGGRPPKFEIGRFELDANFAKRAAVLRYGRDIVAPHVSITVDATVKAYQAAAKAIQGRSVDGAAWIAQLYDAYQNVRRKREISGPRVNIVDVYIELVILRQGRNFAVEPSKRTFSDYSRAQFIYDFYEFTSRQRLTHQGQVVMVHASTKSQTDSPAKSMWIVQGDSPYDGRYFSDIEFVKA
jgi:hypothetical protein